MRERLETLALEVKLAPGDLGSIAGYASLFGRPADVVNDVIEPGAFSATLAEHKAAGTLPAMLREHDGEPVGAWLEIAEDELGLRVKGKIDLATDAGREAYQAVVSGDVDGLSIGFRARKSARSDDGTRTLQEIDLVEISLVRTPAKNTARILAVKSASADASPPAAGAAQHTRSITMLEDNAPASPGNDMTALLDRIEQLEAKAARPAVAPKDSESTERKAWLTYLRKGVQADDVSLKALTVAVDAQAGYLAPAEVSSEFIRQLTEVSPIRAFATVRQSTAPSVKYPKRTALTNAKWEGEVETSEESAPSFGQLEIVSRRLTTYVDISNSLLLASDGTAEAEVRQAFAEDFAKKEGLAFVRGNGVVEPQGILTSSDVAPINNGHATVLSADALIGFMYAVPAFYRNRGVWVMNGNTLAVIRRLKDGQNNYLWQPSFQAGQPETILGRPVVEAVDMPDVASGTTPIVFGDLATGYRIVDRLALSTLSDPYTQARLGITRIHGTMWVGGGVAQGAALRKLLMATN